MHSFPRRALAEWPIVRARLLRTRLGIWLFGLGAWAAWLAMGAEAALPPAVAVRFGMLAAVLAVAYTAGSSADRVAVELSLTHPTTPGAIATGRWLGATAAASIVVVAGACAAVLGGGPMGTAAAALAAGATAAGATAAALLPAVWLGGNAVAGAAFLYIAVFGALSPRGLTPLLPAGPVRTAAGLLLDILPSVWRYAGLATAEPAAWAHAVAWVMGGLALGAATLGRRR